METVRYGWIRRASGAEETRLNSTISERSRELPPLSLGRIVSPACLIQIPYALGVNFSNVILVFGIGLAFLVGSLRPAIGHAEETSAADEGADAIRVPVQIVPSYSSSYRIGDGKPARRVGAAPGLDDLLQIPSGYLQPTARTVSGAGEGEWRRRFEKAQKELRKALTTLKATKRELDEVAGGGSASQWSVAPPGATNTGNGSSTSPLSFRLRQELLRNREGLDSAERALKELRIEADLAGVPVDWRGDANVQIPRRIPESPYYN